MSTTFDTTGNAPVKWVLDMIDEAANKQFTKFMTEDALKTILEKDNQDRTIHDRDLIDKDERAREWLFSKIPKIIKKEVCENAEDVKSTPKLWQKILEVLDVPTWDLEAIISREPKNDDESYGCYLARLSEITELQEDSGVKVKTMLKRVLSHVPEELSKSPLYKIATREFLTKAENNKSYDIKYKDARLLCQEVDELAKTEAPAKANRASEVAEHSGKTKVSYPPYRAHQRHQGCTNRWCDKDDGHTWKTCKFTVCRKCHLQGHVAEACRKE